jgi:protein transport protein SEC24
MLILLSANGEAVMLWFGGAVSPQILDDLYGVEALEELDVRMTRLPKLPTLLSTQIRNILTHLERVIGHTLPVIPVRQNMDGMEIEFANQLVEDSNNDALSYTDCEFSCPCPLCDPLVVGCSSCQRQI